VLGDLDLVALAELTAIEVGADGVADCVEPIVRRGEPEVQAARPETTTSASVAGIRRLIRTVCQLSVPLAQQPSQPGVVTEQIIQYLLGDLLRADQRVDHEGA
jgi:hypothetical protein